jgi:hypothetical protein
MSDFKDLGLYRYRLTDTKLVMTGKHIVKNAASQQTELFQQFEETSYIRASDGILSWTSHLCSHLFGHKACLEKAQR